MGLTASQVEFRAQVWQSRLDVTLSKRQGVERHQQAHLSPAGRNNYHHYNILNDHGRKLHNASQCSRMKVVKICMSHRDLDAIPVVTNQRLLAHA